MSAMSALALAAGEWVEATIGASLEVTVGALDPVPILVYVGPSAPSNSAFVGLRFEPGRHDRLPIEDGDKMFIRSALTAVAGRAVVWPHAEPAV